MADERYKDITVRMLLNHSSGILGTLMFSTMTYGIPSTRYHDSLLPQLAKQRLKADPGEFSVYCNDGFSLAEIIVERVSGMSFSEFVRQRITESVGMTNTKTPQDDFDRTRMARTFFQGEITPYDNCNAIGLGGVYSTAEDLCKLAQAYMDDPGSVAAAELLSDEMRTASMQKEYLRGIWPEPGEGVIGYGLGWDSVGPNFFSEYGIQALFKGGDTVLYHSLLMVLPEHNMAFAVVMSSGSSIMYGLPMAQSVLSQALLAEGKIKEIFPLQDLRAPVASEVPIELMEYAGLYANNSVVSEIAISPDGKATVTPLSTADIPSEIYYYTSDGEFVSEAGDKRITFVKESNGKTYTRLVQTFSLPGLGQVVMTGYDMQRIEANVVDDAVQKAWDLRNGTRYYVLNEIPTSQDYTAPDMVSIMITTSEELPGYVDTCRILDANHAIQDTTIPVMSGRDSIDLEVAVVDGKEYLLISAGGVYLRESDLEELEAGENVACTIQADGYARWFTINEQVAGKTMTVILPEGGSFAVYDAEGLYVHFSVVNGNQPVQLPKNGKVVFVGESPGDRFIISIKE